MRGDPKGAPSDIEAHAARRLLLAALLLVACPGKPGGATPDSEGSAPDHVGTRATRGRSGPPERRSVAPATAAASQTAAPHQVPLDGDFVRTVPHPGAAYFGLDGAGVVQLQSGVFSAVAGVPGLVKAMALGKEGLWVSNLSGLYLLRGEPPAMDAPRALRFASPADKVGDLDTPGAVEELALGADDTLWTLGYAGVSRRDRKGFTLYGRSVFGNARVMRGLAVDGKGAPWVSTALALYRLEGQRWARVDTAEAAGDAPCFDRLARGAGGSILASFAGGLLRCDAARCLPHGDLGERPSSFAAAPDGRVLVVSRLDRLSLLSPGGEVTPIDPAEAGFRAGSMRVVAADAAGRFWLATNLGVVILDREGKAVQWEPGQVGELSRAVLCMAVQGEGPSLPAVRPRLVGVVTGRVLRGGVPVTGATVELCHRPSLAAPDTPCGEAAFRQSGSTDEHGRFSLPEVPVGDYRFAVKAGSTWMVTLAGNCCTTASQTGTFEAGTIALREP